MNLTQIETILLHGAHFTKEQREVIQAKGRIDVVAGPGSGKTTVLAAKVLALLTNRKCEDKGICCITHTNVAVKEILERLKLGGVDEIEYPNFVGTIQSFMDKFLGRVAFANILPEVTLKLLEEEKFYEKYEKNFRRIVTDYPPDYNVPKPANNGCELVIQEDGSFYYTNNHRRYKTAINLACKWLLEDGFISYTDLKSLCYWYLRKYINELSVAFGERFSYLMLDEAQDTDQVQMAIISGLAKSQKLNVQRFGDPYQALYTIYGAETEDSWKPSPDNVLYRTKEISETTRFGSSIAAVVRDVCVEEYEHFHSNQELDFFPKYFITYETGDELKDKQDRLIEGAAASNPEFRVSQMPDAIVGIMHSDVMKIDSHYSKEGAKQRAHEKSVSEIRALIIKLLASANGLSLVEE
ncbi:UvrD-helicase domain-containing protein [Lacticaseibacillus pantheris]|uniref:UvrD-helicase domain-containing protein n=1 Tax=Lacticaseibacillus pantheris TaxID=171523 RepID=UPI002658C8AC|nr:UvrD-helicase domain-containing protein [Lacticaseibacillus pantheris]WKF85916.1 UvrD-helicase domain-containing protein [Lacticaseibacillus pantheris]